jgi:hypothetical protein
MISQNGEKLFKKEDKEILRDKRDASYRFFLIGEGFI